MANKNIHTVTLGQNTPDASLADSLPPLWNEKLIGHTNIGVGRAKNQDALSFFLLAPQKPLHFILAVADGLGSSPYSEQASIYAVTQIPKDLSEGENLMESFARVHRKLVEQQYILTDAEQRKPQLQIPTMGTTTLVLVDIRDDHARIANVGDSRAYLVRQGEIVYQTKDQSLTELLLQNKELKHPFQARRHPLRNVILNALGSPEPTYRFIEEIEGGEKKIVLKPSGLPLVDEKILQKDDYLILATDGFFTNITEEEMVGLIAETPWGELESKLSQAVQRILRDGETSLGEAANPDNYTFVVYRHS